MWSPARQCISFHLFADDTCLFYSNKNVKKLEANVTVALNNVSNWLKANKLTLNVKRSHPLIFNMEETYSIHKLQAE